MTTILAIFIIALVLSLVLTPLLGKLGLRFGAVDEPEERKVHIKPVLRCCGCKSHAVMGDIVNPR